MLDMRSIKVRGEKPGKVSRPCGALGGHSVLGKVDIYHVDHEVAMWVCSPKENAKGEGGGRRYRLGSESCSHRLWDQASFCGLGRSSGRQPGEERGTSLGEALGPCA